MEPSNKLLNYKSNLVQQYIQEYIKPGYTIEVGKGVSPVPLNQFPTIYDQNEEILLLASVV